MKPYSFYKISAAGNTTLFITLPSLAQANRELLLAAMSKEGVSAEQGAFADLEAGRLEMAGGEFCANACRSMGSLLDLNRRENGGSEAEVRHYSVSLVGQACPIELFVTGACPVWEISASFTLDLENCEMRPDLIHLPGISHLLVPTEKLPQSEAVPELACGLAPACSRQVKALGVVWWRKNERGAEILPYVRVPAAGTAMLEQACGSASIALAFAMHEKGRESGAFIRQPSGEELFCAIGADDRSVVLSGAVKLLASGTLWLNEAGARP